MKHLLLIKKKVALNPKNLQNSFKNGVHYDIILK